MKTQSSIFAFFVDKEGFVDKSRRKFNHLTAKNFI